MKILSYVTWYAIFPCVMGLEALLKCVYVNEINEDGTPVMDPVSLGIGVVTMCCVLIIAVIVIAHHGKSPTRTPEQIEKGDKTLCLVCLVLLLASFCLRVCWWIFIFSRNVVYRESGILIEPQPQLMGRIRPVIIPTLACILYLLYAAKFALHLQTQTTTTTITVITSTTLASSSSSLSSV